MGGAAAGGVTSQRAPQTQAGLPEPVVHAQVQGYALGGIFKNPKRDFMSKYVCKCGYVFILSTGNEEYDCRIVKNSKIEEIGGSVNDGNMNEEEFYNKIDSGALTIYICPECKRVHISTPDLYSRFFSVYKKED